MALVLWHTPNSVCSQKVRIALDEIGIEWEEYIPDTANFEQHTSAFREISPDGVVPVLLDNGLVVRESSLIIEYLDETKNDGRLMPASGPTRVSAKLWLIKCLAIHAAINSLTFATLFRDADLQRSEDELERRFAAIPDAAIRAKRRDLFSKGTSSAYVEAATRELGIILDLMSKAIKQDGWVSGETYSLGDIALTAYCDRMDRVGLRSMLSARPSVAEWLDRCRNRPSYAEAITSRIGPIPSGDQRKQLEARWQGVAGTD